MFPPTFVRRCLRILAVCARMAVAGLGAVSLFVCVLIVLQSHGTAAHAIHLQGLHSPPRDDSELLQWQVLGGVDSTAFPSVTLLAQLTDMRGRPIRSGLTVTEIAKELNISANGVQSNVLTSSIHLVDAPPRPVAVALILDVVVKPDDVASFNQMTQAVVGWLSQLGSQTQVAVITASAGAPAVLQPPTSNHKATTTSVAALKPVPGTRTNMADAIRLAQSILRAQTAPQSLLYVVSDQGGDWSKTTATALQSLFANKIDTYAFLSKPTPDVGSVTQVLSEALAATPRGTAFETPMNALQGRLHDMTQGYAQVYTLTFACNTELLPVDDKRHSFSISLKGSEAKETAGTLTATRQRVPISVTVDPPLVTSVLTQSLTLGVAMTGTTITALLSLSPVQQVEYWLYNSNNAPQVLTTRITETLLLTTPLELAGLYSVVVHLVAESGHWGVYPPIAFEVKPKLNIPLPNVRENTAANTVEMHMNVSDADAALIGPTGYVQVWFSGLGPNNLTTTFAGKTAFISRSQDLFLPGTYVLSGTVIDQYGRVTPLPLRTSSSPDYVKPFPLIPTWVWPVLAWLLAAGVLVARWLRRSARSVVLRLSNDGNIATEYELRPTDPSQSFAITLRHHAAQMMQRVNAVAGASAGNAAPSTQPQAAPATRPRTANQSAPSQRANPAASAQTATNTLANAADVLGGFGTLFKGRLGDSLTGASRTLRRPQAQLQGAQNAQQRVKRIGAQITGMSNPSASGAAAPQPPRHNAIEEDDWDDDAQSDDTAPTKPVARAQPAAVVPSGETWWVVPTIEPGHSEDIEIAVRPHWPYGERACNLTMQIRTVAEQQAIAGLGRPAVPPASVQEKIEMPSGLWPWLLLLGALLFVAVVLVALYLLLVPEAVRAAEIARLG